MTAHDLAVWRYEIGPRAAQSDHEENDWPTIAGRISEVCRVAWQAINQRGQQ